MGRLFRLLVSGSTYKEFGSVHSVLKKSKKLFTKKLTTLLGFIREERTQDKPQFPMLERQTGKYREGCFP